jgi:hypothetical protein
VGPFSLLLFAEVAKFLASFSDILKGLQRTAESDHTLSTQQGRIKNIIYLLLPYNPYTFNSHSAQVGQFVSM